MAERFITFIVGFHCYFLNKLFSVSKYKSCVVCLGIGWGIYPLWVGTCSKGLIAQLNPWVSGYRGSCFILVSCLYLTQLLLASFPTHPPGVFPHEGGRETTFIVGFQCYFLNKLLSVLKYKLCVVCLEIGWGIIA